MFAIARLGDRLVSRLVPRIEASALWYWSYYCLTAYCYRDGVRGNRQLWREHCHDGSGYCTDPELISCDC